eukprot:TRINITY_DN8045_c0_g1_i1.p3 TRINITY_DN8045_c0_g1~~TRINITY_DN8045_c0_g1_i1.p3  ORF type:complete len:84 (-),score=8.95 TRINITY_DN8045_c0_g1_i1:383-634(-)
MLFNTYCEVFLRFLREGNDEVLAYLDNLAHICGSKEELEALLQCEQWHFVFNLQKSTLLASMVEHVVWQQPEKQHIWQKEPWT